LRPGKNKVSAGCGGICIHFFLALVDMAYRHSEQACMILYAVIPEQVLHRLIEIRIQHLTGLIVELCGHHGRRRDLLILSLHRPSSTAVKVD